MNRSGKPVILTFGSAQRFDFVLRDGYGTELWRWAKGRMFALLSGGETIPPSATLSYTVKLEAPLLPGVYAATGFLTTREGQFAASVVVPVEPR